MILNTLIPELINLAKTSNMKSKHAAALIYEKTILCMATNNSYTIENSHILNNSKSLKNDDFNDIIKIFRLVKRINYKKTKDNEIDQNKIDQKKIDQNKIDQKKIDQNKIDQNSQKIVLNKTDLLKKFNNKQLIHLKKEIKRTGYVLAHHAEENVINYFKDKIEPKKKNKKNFYRNKFTIVVIRINNNNELKSSNPCAHCVNVMKLFGIRKVIYSTNDGNFISELLENIQTNNSVGYNSLDLVLNTL
jgi:tRNA(Arg) A34 adenosine deaminase TadA